MLRKVDSPSSQPPVPGHEQGGTAKLRRQSSSELLGSAMNDIHPGANGQPSSPRAVRSDSRRDMPEQQRLGGRTFGRADALDRAHVPGLNPPPRPHTPAPALPPRTMTLQVPMPGGATAAWTPSVDALGPGLAKLVKSNKVGLTAVQTEVQDKVNRGAALAQQLATAPGPLQLSERDVTDVMWFMQARAEAKTGKTGVTDIAFTLPDPHGSFLRSLDQTTSATHGSLAYQRASTHLPDFQKVHGGGGAPRGINFNWDKDTPSNLDKLLPNGKETILYQKMSQGVHGYPENRIFIKPEDHGMYYSKPAHGDDPDGPHRKSLKYDKTHCAGHIMTTGPSIYRQVTGNNSPEGTFKERMPPQMAKSYKAIMVAAEKAELPHGAIPLNHFFTPNNPTNNSAGLHAMMDNINNFMNHYGNDLEFQRNNPELMKEISNFAQTYMNGGLYDNADVRVGQEIIFKNADL